MKQFLFPAVFLKEEDKYVVLFPDLNITTDGDTIEEAYLFAKDSLKVYCTYVVKFDLDIDTPSKFEKVCKDNPQNLVMLVDCFIMPNKTK